MSSLRKDPDARAQSEAVHKAANVIAETLRDRGEVTHQLRELLLAGGVRSTVDLITLWPQALERTIETVRLLMESILADIAPEQTRTHAIRRLFLEPHDTYTMDELAALWRVPRREAEDILVDEVAAWKDAHPAESPRISQDQALWATVAFNVVRPVEVEIALAEQFEGVRGKAWRAVPVLIHLPRLVTDAIGRMALPSRQELAARIEHFVLDRFFKEQRLRPNGSKPA